MGPTFQRKLTKNHLIFSLFVLNINSLVVQGFTLRSCRISLDVAICSNISLKEVPNDIHSTVKGIDLSSNKIQKIQVSNFKHFPDLTALDLKQNNISSIGKGTFTQLISLQLLSLNSNHLVKLDDGVFDGLLNLKELRIGSNRIKAVGPNAFRDLKNLRTLVLSGNKLQGIAQVSLIIQHMPHLTDLYIQRIGISTFKSWELTNKSTELRLLDMTINPIEVFQVTANVFPNLSRLSIGKPSMKLNMTWDVPDKAALDSVSVLDVSSVQMPSNEEMRKLLSSFNSSLVTLKINAMQCRPTVLINNSCSIPTLSELQLTGNKLSFIGSYLFTACVNVTEIDLSKNVIKIIANDSFTAIPQLRKLSLSHNKLESVPFATRNLPLLYKLDLSFNLIHTLGCFDFANLTKLQYLSLQYNKIRALTSCAFQHLPQLIFLELQGNSLAKIMDAFRTSLPSLQILRLSNNSLTTIKREEFSGLLSLTNLTLFDNKIISLEKRCFAGLKNLQNLQLQNNNIKTLGDCFKDLVNLRNLDLGNNHIKFMRGLHIKEPIFSHLSNLETLSFPAQHFRGKSQLPPNLLQGLTNLTTLNCKNNQLINITEDLFVHTPKLDSLDISANDLMEFPPNLFAPIPNLTKLRATSLNLHSLDFLIGAKLKKLTFLQARKNSFSVISQDVIDSVPNLKYLDLQFNRFMCDCDNSDFLKWIIHSNQTQVAYAYNFKCEKPSHMKGQILLDLNVESCLNQYIYFISTTCMTLVVMVASFTYHLMRFQLAYAYYILLAWLYDTKNKNKRAPCQYDAFVSYNVHDEGWVFRELVPHLEEQQGWKLCLHHRDFEPGRPIVDNITDAIYGSRKTLCVISRRYLQSEWCSRELQVASFRLFDERKDVLILVFLEDIPTAHLSPYYRMRKVLKRQTYLSWPRAGQQVNLFWEKLRQALTSADIAAEDRLLLTVTDGQ